MKTPRSSWIVSNAVRVSEFFFSSPYSLLVGWIIFLISPLFSMARFFLAHKASFLNETIKDAVSVCFILLTYAIIPYCFFILVIWTRRFRFKVLPKQQLIVLSFIALSSVCAWLFHAFLIHLENVRYSNFLYSKTGITINSLNNRNNVLLFTLVMVGYIFYRKFMQRFAVAKKNQRVPEIFQVVEKLTFAGVQKLIVLFGFLLAVTSSLFPWTHGLSNLAVARQGYPEKFGVEYEFIQLLQQTPPQATLIHPPQSGTWPLIGNQPMIRYFLFPRVLVSGVLVTDQAFVQQFKTAYFVEIKPTSGVSAWPIIGTAEKKLSFNGTDWISYETLATQSAATNSILYYVEFDEK